MGEPVAITMQDVRLVAGEGKLSAATVLQACNVIVKQRHSYAHPETPVQRETEPLDDKLTYIKPLRTLVRIQTTYADQIRDWLNDPTIVAAIRSLAVQPPVHSGDSIQPSIADCGQCNEQQPHAPSPTPKEIQVALDKILPWRAIEVLRGHQEQLDFDGCMVGVSRQALDEVLTIFSPTVDIGGQHD